MCIPSEQTYHTLTMMIEMKMSCFDYLKLLVNNLFFYIIYRQICIEDFEFLGYSQNNKCYKRRNVPCAFKNVSTTEIHGSYFSTYWPFCTKCLWVGILVCQRSNRNCSRMLFIQISIINIQLVTHLNKKWRVHQ